MSMRTIAVRAAGLAALTLFAAQAAHADGSSYTPIADITHASGEEIYTHICQGCHMAQGEGAVGAGHYPALAGDPRLASWQYLALTVLYGRNGMPGFGLPADQAAETMTVRLSDAQIAELANYVRSHFGNAYPDKATEADVAALPHPGSAKR